MSARAIALRALSITAFAVALCVGAWWMQSYTPQATWLRLTMRSEAFHITAHLLLYGALYLLCRGALARSRRFGVALAVALTMSVALTQEAVQVITYRGRSLSKGEWFDLAVDMIAIAIAEVIARRT
jgi:hypothetical protein